MVMAQRKKNIMKLSKRKLNQMVQQELNTLLNEDRGRWNPPGEYEMKIPVPSLDTAAERPAVSGNWMEDLLRTSAEMEGRGPGVETMDLRPGDIGEPMNFPALPSDTYTPEYYGREVGEGGPPLPGAPKGDPGWSPQPTGPPRDIDPGWSPEPRGVPAPSPSPLGPVQPVGPGTFNETTSKISRNQLNQIIQEETQALLNEDWASRNLPSWMGGDSRPSLATRATNLGRRMTSPEGIYSLIPNTVKQRLDTHDVTIDPTWNPSYPGSPTGQLFGIGTSDEELQIAKEYQMEKARLEAMEELFPTGGLFESKLQQRKQRRRRRK